MHLNISTFLDPRFKLPSFLTDDEKQPLLEFIENEVIDNTLITVKKKNRKYSGRRGKSTKEEITR